MNVTREKSALLSLETRGDDAERLAVWLTTFLGEDVFRRLEENENLHVSMLEEKKDVTGWLTAGLKTILKSEDLELLVQRVEQEIQELQKRLIVAEEIQVSNQDITADCERHQFPRMQPLSFSSCSPLFAKAPTSPPKPLSPFSVVHNQPWRFRP